MAIEHRRGWAPEALFESEWYYPIAALFGEFHASSRFPTPAELSAQYARASAAKSELPDAAKALRFVATPPKKRRVRRGPVDLAALYEGRIVLGGEVPTRLDDWHDFFNALTFTAFPRAKWALHARQFALLKARITPGATRLPGARSREQDALALLDEGGIALVLRPELARELAPPTSATFSSDCEALCRSGEARAVPFGHALPEHLVEGLPLPLGAPHVLALDFHGLANKALIDAVDLALSKDLAEPALFSAPSPARGLSLQAIATTGASIEAQFCSRADPRAST
jgi:Protein of unknown function (DUF3025)